MKFGLRYCNTARYTNPANAVELVQAGEEAGFESAWTVDHVVVPEGYESQYPYSDDGRMAGGKNDIPLPDPLIWMAYVAARTSRITRIYSSVRGPRSGKTALRALNSSSSQPTPMPRSVRPPDMWS